MIPTPKQQYNMIFSKDALSSIIPYLTARDILNLSLICKQSKELVEESTEIEVRRLISEEDWQHKWRGLQDRHSVTVVPSVKGTNAYQLIYSKIDNVNVSWIDIYHSLEQMKSGLIFHRFIGPAYPLHGIIDPRITPNLAFPKQKPSYGGLKYHQNNLNMIEMKKIRRSNEVKEVIVNSVGVCNNVMANGRHYAEVTVLKGGNIGPGIMKSISDDEDERLASDELDGGVEDTPDFNDGGLMNFVIYYEQEIGTINLFGINCAEHRDARLSWYDKGDVIGMLFDFDLDCLLLFINGRHVSQVDNPYNLQTLFGPNLQHPNGQHFSWAVAITQLNEHTDRFMEMPPSSRAIVKIEEKSPPLHVLKYLGED